jgi:hypothetical protein
LESLPPTKDFQIVDPATFVNPVGHQIVPFIVITHNKNKNQYGHQNTRTTIDIDGNNISLRVRHYRPYPVHGPDSESEEIGSLYLGDPDLYNKLKEKLEFAFKRAAEVALDEEPLHGTH